MFGLTSLWRGNSAPAAGPATNTEITRKNAAAADSLSFKRVEAKNTVPESPAKRASESQLANRRILNPSRLNQTFSASDMAGPSSSVPRPTNFSSSMAGTAVRRMPGDNPNKARPLFAGPTTPQLPSDSFRKTTNFSGGASATPARNFSGSASTSRFRNTAFQRPGLPNFSPRAPASSTRQNFPPSTPGKAPRGSTADVAGRALAQTTSADLFKMRIPSPPRDLTGEAMAKEVPNDLSRVGSIYADEFLAHYCPSDLDEQQRRQFFCILDLRRLKYAADEVFTKKDWKINVSNFSKEYEKSRSLIMLRYGLYEFKTVRASETVKKEWKQKHGIADSEDEDMDVTTFKTNGVPKRKAEEELTPDDTALTTSSSIGNKRARAPEAATPAPVKTKRKADVVGEPDENHPAKLLKPVSSPHKTPSATKSVFESIANNTQSTPAQASAKVNAFGSSVTPTLFNGSTGASVFAPGAKPPVTTDNIFGHLSDSSKDDAESGDETGSNPEEDNSEVQLVGQSKETSVAASEGVSTPQFGTMNTANTVNGASSASSDAGDSSQGRSIFDRITRGNDGQPVRKLPSPQEGNAQLFAPTSSDKSRSASPVKEAAPPANNTWNTSTPIKFSSAASAFGSAIPKPASSTVDFGAQKKTDEPAAPIGEAPKEPPTQNMSGAFGAKPADSSNTSVSIFGSNATSANTGSQLFGSSTLAFGQSNEKKETKEPTTVTAPGSSSCVFGSKPEASAPEVSKPSVFQSSTLFGSKDKSESEKTEQTPAANLFGQPEPAEAKPVQAPTADLFAAAASAKPLSNLFGTPSAASTTATADEPAAKKATFGSTENKSGSALFGFTNNSSNAPKAAATSETKSLFGASSTPAPETKSLFGASSTPAAAAVPQTKNLFGTTSAAPVASMFGNNSSRPEATNAVSLFGNTSNPAAPSSNGNMFAFGNAQPPAASQLTTSQPSGSIFGTMIPGVNTSFTFSTGGSDATVINNPFASNNGTTSTPSSFTFGSGGNTQPPSFAFGNTSQSFNAGSAPNTSFGGGTQQSISFGAGSETSSQQGNMFGGAANGGPVFSFGGASSQPSSGPVVFGQTAPSAPSMFGSSLAPGGGGSTGTNSPFTFGGASSLATTPAAGTPEAVNEIEEGKETKADGDEGPQEQISLTDGGPGEEDESVVHEVRAKALKLVDVDGDGENDNESKKKEWKTQGVGPFRIMKHKTTGAVRMLLRAEPRGHVALNKTVLPNFTYKVEPAGGKLVKVTTASDDGKSLESWLLQVKTPAFAQALADRLEEHKTANKK